MKKWLGMIAIVFLFLKNPISVYAVEAELEGYDFGEINKLLEEVFPQDKIEFQDAIVRLMDGEIDFSVGWLRELVMNQLFYEIQHSKSSVVQIIIIVLMAAIFANFSGVFKSVQTAEISSMVLYMLLVTICVGNFRVLISATAQQIERVVQFIQVLGPIYFMAVSLSTGTSTSIAFYQIILILIMVVELVVLNFLLPFVQIYFVVCLLNEFTPELKLSKLSDLIQTMISWTLKTLFAGVLGLNVIQRLLSPAIDAVKRNILTSGGEALPIIGNAVGQTAEVVIGTAVLIKNGIGVAGMMIAIAICAAPIMQMVVTCLSYQLIAALIQPISDRRMVECLSNMARGCGMLLKIMATTAILFLLTIAIVATTGGSG